MFLYMPKVWFQNAKSNCLVGETNGHRKKNKQTVETCNKLLQKNVVVCKWYVLIRNDQKQQLCLHKNLFFCYFLIFQTLDTSNSFLIPLRFRDIESRL